MRVVHCARQGGGGCNRGPVLRVMAAVFILASLQFLFLESQLGLRGFRVEEVGPPVPDDQQLAVFCIARLEAPYIEEWVLYHLHIGVDIIYIYDNEEVPTYGALFEGNPRVVVIPFAEGRDVVLKGLAPQYAAIAHFMRHLKARHTWALHIDVDEFVYLKQRTSLKDLARELISGDDATGLALPWRFATTCGDYNFFNDSASAQVALPWIWLGPAALAGGPGGFVNRPVLTRFTAMHSNPSRSPAIKTLFLTKAAKAFKTCHEVRYHSDWRFPRARTVATTGETVKGPVLPAGSQPRGLDPEVQLIHFRHKSCAENVFRRSFRGGRADLVRGVVDPEAAAPGGAVLRLSPEPAVMALQVPHLRAALADKWPECVAMSQGDHAQPETALRDLWMGQLDAVYRATSRYRPAVLDIG